MYVEQPLEFDDLKHSHAQFVCKLNKGLHNKQTTLL